MLAVDLRGRHTWILSSFVVSRRHASGYGGQLVAKPGELRFTSRAQAAEPGSVGFEAREVGQELREKSRP